MEKLMEYAKALIPLLAGAVLLVLDKAFLDDNVPDEVWLGLLGTAPFVWAVPNASVPRKKVVASYPDKP